jgi:hypothetical protein
MVPKGGSTEYNYGEKEGTALPNNPGLYFHPQAGKFIETAGVKRPDGSTSYATDSGKIQADAFVQFGYRPATAEEAKEYRARQEAEAAERRKKDTATTVSMSSTK